MGVKKIGNKKKNLENRIQFDSKYNQIIVTCATGFVRGKAEIPIRDARLCKYRPENLKHNLEYISERVEESDLLKSVLSGKYSYEEEVMQLFSFYKELGSYEDLKKSREHEVLADYEKKLNLLIEDLNGFILDEIDEYENADCLKEVDETKLSKELAKKIAESSDFKQFLDNCLKKENREFDGAHRRLVGRALKVDSFLRNVRQLYEDLERISKVE